MIECITIVTSLIRGILLTKKVRASSLSSCSAVETQTAEWLFVVKKKKKKKKQRSRYKFWKMLFVNSFGKRHGTISSHILLR